MPSATCLISDFIKGSIIGAKWECAMGAPGFFDPRIRPIYGVGAVLSRVYGPVKGALIATGVELLTGKILNSNHELWDFRDLGPNIDGQVSVVSSTAYAIAMKMYLDHTPALRDVLKHV